MNTTIIRRINLSNCDHLKEVSFNLLTNFLAIGDKAGMLQVVNFPQLESQSANLPQSREDSFSQKRNAFQGIFFHKSKISKITWNVLYNKLTTVDKGGLMVVWKSNKNVFEYEMVNNRGESNLTDVRWSKKGDKICFIYQDGFLYSGTVDGKNSWYNRLEPELFFVEWSPDGNKILISQGKDKIFVCSASGSQIGEIVLNDKLRHLKIISIEWWGGSYLNMNSEVALEENAGFNEADSINKKHLLIAFEEGLVILIDNETDNNPILLKTELKRIVKAEWEVSGYYLCVVGDNASNPDVSADNSEIMDNNSIHSFALFYSSRGELIKKVELPTRMVSFSWGLNSSIAYASNRSIYLGFTKYQYKWTYFSDTIVFGFILGEDKYNIIFIGVQNNTKQNKLMYNLVDIISGETFCSIICNIPKENLVQISLTNSYGNVLDTKKCNIKAKFYSMNDEFVCISDGNYIYLLQYKNYGKLKKSTEINQNTNYLMNSVNVKLEPKNMHEICFYIDDLPNNDAIYNFENFNATKNNKAPLNALTLSKNYLLTYRKNGQFTKYNLYSKQIEHKFTIKDNIIQKIGISPLETYLWCIDIDDLLTIYKISDNKNEKCNFSKKDVWEVAWRFKTDAEGDLAINDMDVNTNINTNLNINNEMKNNNIELDKQKEENLDFVCIEKNKINFYSNLEQENESNSCKYYLANYEDNEALTVKVDELNFERNKETFQGKDYIKLYPNKIHREFVRLLDESPNLKDAYDYALQNPCRKFFNMLAKRGLKNLNFDMAQKSMVQVRNYDGLEFIKEVQEEQDTQVQKAEIEEFIANYDDAARFYQNANRNDLNLAMQMKLGKWDVVTDIMANNVNSDKDAENLKIAYNNYADELFEKKDYEKALEYYKKAGNIIGMVKCYFAMEEYDKAAELIDQIPDGEPFLSEMGDKFKSLGMTEEAVRCYLKNGDIKKAIETYMMYNMWDKAIDLSAKNNFIFMEQLANKYSKEFKESGRKMDLLNLYRKAHMRIEVCKHLEELGNDMRKIRLGPFMIKKIFVLAALEMEQYKCQISDSQIGSEDSFVAPKKKEEKGGAPSHHKEEDDKIDYCYRDLDKAINNYWKGAEAYHFYMLCQVQLYRKQYKEACKTVMRLQLYEKELGTEDVYRLIALCSYLNKCFQICSYALGILENLEIIDKQRRRKYRELTESIFFNYTPKNIDEKFYKCPNNKCNQPISEYDIYCKSCGMNFNPCVLTGQSILDHNYFKCKQCRHKTIKVAVKKHPIKHCPLCHISLREKKQ